MENLNTKILEEKKKIALDNFNKIQGEIREIEANEAMLGQKKKELNVELFRLQGENRLIDDLLANPEQPEAPAPAKPEGQ